ncbi:MAG: response regulator [Anaerolineae bacterium]|nr:response regulator [Anaerolineae bacterium]
MTEPQPDTFKGNILVVDDTPANLRFLSQMLSEQGYKVRPTRSGQLALDAVRAAAPDLVLLDVKMPELDGYEVCARLKSDPHTRDIPVIFISAMDEVEDKIKAFDAGGVDYVTKPFHFEEVLARVETHLTLQRLQNQLVEHSQHLERLVEKKVLELEQERAKSIHAAKLASLGEMATGVAHELNQPLTAMLFDADYLKMLADRMREGTAAPDADELEQLGGNFAADIARCRRIIDHLRAFGRLSGDQRTPVNLNDAVEGCFILVGARLREHGVDVDLSLSPDLPPILGDVHKLEQVLLNLISNAEYALETTARLLNDGSVQRPGWQKALAISTFVEAESVVATVHDNGCGIPANARERIFEPFFTTKPVGEGTGLGLSISYGIVNEFDGQIDLESAEHQGTTFTLRFPVAHSR